MANVRTTWDDNPTVRSTWDDEPAQPVAPELNALERTALSYGTGAVHGLRKAANWSFGMPSAPGAIQEPAIRKEADALRKLTEGHPYSGGLPAFVGEVVGPAVATAPLNAPVGLGLAGRAILGGVQGLVQGRMTAGPDEAPDVANAGVGATVAAAAPPLVRTLLGGGRRASMGAVKMFESGLDKLREIAEKYRPEGAPIEEGLIQAGNALRNVKIDGKRLVTPGKSMGTRGVMLDTLGEEANAAIDNVMTQADSMGARVDPDAVISKLNEIKYKHFGGPAGNLTSTQRSGQRAMDDLIARYKQGFGEKYLPTGQSIEGEIPSVTRPLELPVRNEAGAVVGTEPGISSSRVAASAPDTSRVFEPPVDLGKIIKKDARGRFMPGEVAPQPRLQSSEVVQTPTDADGFWRSFGEQDPLVSRSQPSRAGPHWLQEEVSPAHQGPIASEVELVGQPVSEHEAAKRAVGKEGYLRGARYFDANAPKQDPGVQAFRQSYGVLKGAVEDALPQDLLEQFLPAKAKSQIAQVFGPQAETAELGRHLTSGSARSTLRGEVRSTLLEQAMKHMRPYLVTANEGLESVGKSVPPGTQAALRQAVIEMLRQQEK